MICKSQLKVNMRTTLKANKIMQNVILENLAFNYFINKTNLLLYNASYEELENISFLMQN